MTLWHSYYFAGAGGGLLIAALFAYKHLNGYIHAPDWCRKEMLGSICWLIFMHGVAWPFAGLLVAAFFYFWKVGGP